jgi:hypothetical protein
MYSHPKSIKFSEPISDKQPKPISLKLSSQKMKEYSDYINNILLTSSYHTWFQLNT